MADLVLDWKDGRATCGPFWLQLFREAEGAVWEVDATSVGGYSSAIDGGDMGAARLIAESLLREHLKDTLRLWPEIAAFAEIAALVGADPDDPAGVVEAVRMRPESARMSEDAWRIAMGLGTSAMDSTTTHLRGRRSARVMAGDLPKEDDRG